MNLYPHSLRKRAIGVIDFLQTLHQNTQNSPTLSSNRHLIGSGSKPCLKLFDVTGFTQSSLCQPIKSQHLTTSKLILRTSISIKKGRNCTFIQIHWNPLANGQILVYIILFFYLHNFPPKHVSFFLSCLAVMNSLQAWKEGVETQTYSWPSKPQ